MFTRHMQQLEAAAVTV